MQRSAQINHISQRQVGLNHIGQLLSKARYMQQHISRGYAVVNRHNKMLLAADAAYIALFITITHILNSGFAIHMLHTLFQINFKAVPSIVIIHIFFDINIYATDGIDQAHKALKIHHHVIINLDAQKLLRGLLGELATTIGIGMVNLVPAIALDAHACITWH